MEKIKEKIGRVRELSQTPRAKKVTYIVLVAILAMWVLYRFVAIGLMNHMRVFNPARDAVVNGVPVEVLEMHRTSGVIKEPLTVKNNRAFVSGARAHLLRPGQKIGDGEIVSVASNIDLDTGMHVVRTARVADGLQFAEFKTDGYFVPVHAVTNGVVFVVRDGVAVAQKVTVGRSDVETAYVTDGLAEGDVVIVSRVAEGDKVQIKK